MTCLAGVDFIEERSPQIMQEYRSHLTEKIQELLGDTQMDLHLQQTGWYPRNKEKQKKQHRNLKRKETDFLCCFCCESAVTAGHPVWKQSGAVRPSCR